MTASFSRTTMGAQHRFIQFIFALFFLALLYAEFYCPTPVHDIPTQRVLMIAWGAPFAVVFIIECTIYKLEQEKPPLWLHAVAFISTVWVFAWFVGWLVSLFAVFAK